MATPPADRAPPPAPAIPTSRLGRFARLAALGTRAGASRIATALGGDAGAEAHLAKAAAEALGTMRGLALKVGQMASYVDGFVPDEHRDLYEKQMRSLRDAAPTMTAAAAARVVEEDLGAPPEKLFAAWTPEPFASASIGQVHRATLHDGREVAVKVQYEGVARAVASDLSNVSMFTALAGPLGGRFAVKAQVAELRARFLEELDYAHEAAQQRRFAAAFAPAPEGAAFSAPAALRARVRVPAVIDELCGRRVLTTELAHGLGFEAACAASEPERAAWAETLWTFVFESLLGHGLFNADPHPGNYLFAEGGAIWFLDFGCTREVPPAQLARVREAHRAASRGEEAAFLAAARAMMDIPERGAYADFAQGYVLRCFAPILARGPFHITRPYAKSLFDGMREGSAAMLKNLGRDYVPVPAEWLFFNRLQLGFYSVLARLDVAVDYGALQRRQTAPPAGACEARPGGA